MSATLEALAHDARVLPPDQRLLLARRLLESVDLGSDTGVEIAWDAEIEQRLARYDSGETGSVPVVEVFARLREIAPGE